MLELVTVVLLVMMLGIKLKAVHLTLRCMLLSMLIVGL
jgi:hypothetical protein